MPTSGKSVKSGKSPKSSKNAAATREPASPKAVMARAAAVGTVSWAAAPAQHDYPAAASYLRLIASDDLVDALTTALAQAPTGSQHAKDILRAARLPLLPPDDPAVISDLRKVAAGIELSPILLVRGSIAADHPLTIADGYHRVCASYHLSENTEIPCRLVALPLVAD